MLNEYCDETSDGGALKCVTSDQSAVIGNWSPLIPIQTACFQTNHIKKKIHLKYHTQVLKSRLNSALNSFSA